MIKLCLPISNVDSVLASSLAQRFAQHSDMKERELLVTMCWADFINLNLERFVEFLRPVFKTVNVYVMPDVPEGETWPAAANHMFYHSMAWIAQSGNKEPVYFFEADNFPLQRGWLAAFDAEYAEAGKPYMGVLQPSHWMVRSTGEIIQRGQHMVGTGIYPADFMERCKGVHTLDMIAWDMILADEIVPECHHTDLIAHQWNTENYHLVDGVLMGKKRDPEARLKRKVFGNIKTGEVSIPKGALVIHGCKDLSLYGIDFPS